ncbi:phage tail domain-containing protein [Lysinibacillus sp. SGAir0095]|uniref:phage tail domain-containing protein n=1 Tax=Lysinibacillus sp. SGAir0095 TaxID=2070463 RepID=UPI0010CD4494|nr:phage tail domain-containing protein [Lysinibacillus sp. SGAir0095]QCR33122.1 hypothetical protein C1N55_13440 [Lysinibacillus sp. SGAir0095]
MITVIEKLDGTRINLFDKGVLTADFVVSPIDLKTDSENISGRPGRILTSFDYGNRAATLNLYALADSRLDTITLRDRIAELIDGNEPFYIYEGVTPKLYGFQLPGEVSNRNAYEQSDTYILEGKRLLIYRIGNGAIKFSGLTGNRNIEFETYELPFWESSKTTLELSELAKEWNINPLILGMGIEWDEDYTWEFTSAYPIVRNLGNVPVNPRYMPLKITIKGDFPNGVTLTNQTTGESVTFSGSLTASDTLVFDGVQYLKNGVNVSYQTNYGLIKLKPGENQISITGGSLTSVKFDFRFYFK